MENRYLANSKKEETLGWLYSKERWRTVDKPFRRWIKKLNKISGLVTLQSCSGHKLKNSGYTYHNDANIWIWLSESMAKLYHRRAFEIAIIKGVSRVYTLYSSWGREVADITFNSIEIKDGKRIMKEVIDFFKDLEKEVKQEE